MIGANGINNDLQICLEKEAHGADSYKTPWTKLGFRT